MCGERLGRRGRPAHRLTTLSRRAAAAFLLALVALAAGLLSPGFGGVAYAQTPCGTLPTVGTNTDGSETIWSACLTVKDGYSLDATGAGYYSIPDPVEGALTSTSFTYGGTTFSINAFGTFSGSTVCTDPTELAFHIRRIGAGGDWSDSDASWELHIGSHTLDFADNDRLNATRVEWCGVTSAQLGFTDGSHHTVKIVKRNAPSAPTGVSATAASSTAMRLAWTAPSSTGGSDITGYAYRVRTGSTWGDWTAIEDSASLTSHVVTGLSATTTYGFEMRATNTVGDGPSSDVAEGTTGGTTHACSTDSATNRIWTGNMTDGDRVTISRDYVWWAGTTVPPSISGDSLTDKDFSFGGETATSLTRNQHS